MACSIVTAGFGSMRIRLGGIGIEWPIMPFYSVDKYARMYILARSTYVKWDPPPKASGMLKKKERGSSDKVFGMKLDWESSCDCCVWPRRGRWCGLGGGGEE